MNSSKAATPGIELFNMIPYSFEGNKITSEYQINKTRL
jgi:hypothetical protein